MNEKAIRSILYVSGAVTALDGALQFLAPTRVLHAQHVEVEEPAGRFFARHWGLLVLCIGGLLVYAARRPEIRRPVMLAGAAEKLGLGATMAMSRPGPALAGMRPSVAFDGVCAVLYLIYLLRRGRSPAAARLDAGAQV